MNIWIKMQMYIFKKGLTNAHTHFMWHERHRKRNWNREIKMKNNKKNEMRNCNKKIIFYLIFLRARTHSFTVFLSTSLSSRAVILLLFIYCLRFHPLDIFKPFHLFDIFFPPFQVKFMQTKPCSSWSKNRMNSGECKFLGHWGSCQKSTFAMFLPFFIF